MTRLGSSRRNIFAVSRKRYQAVDSALIELQDVLLFLA